MASLAGTTAEVECFESSDSDAPESDPEQDVEVNAANAAADKPAVPAVEPVAVTSEPSAKVLLAGLAKLLDKRAKRSPTVSVHGHSKPADVRKPKPFNGEGVMASAGAVRRFTDALQLSFQL